MTARQEAPWRQDLRLRLLASDTPDLGDADASAGARAVAEQIADKLLHDCEHGTLHDSFFFDVYRVWLAKAATPAFLSRITHAAAGLSRPPCIPSLLSLARSDARWAKVLKAISPKPRRTTSADTPRPYNLRLPPEQATWLEGEAQKHGESPQGIVKGLIQQAMAQESA